MRTAPKIGELRSELILEEPVAVVDGQGGRTVEWSAVGLIYGRVEPTGRRETLEDGRLTGLVTHIVTVRQRSDIVSGQRLIAGARALRILATVPIDQSGRFLDLLAEEER